MRTLMGINLMPVMDEQGIHGMKDGIVKTIGRTAPAVGSRKYTDFLKSVTCFLHFQSDDNSSFFIR